MILAVDIVLWIIGFILLVPIVVLFIECAAALLPKTSQKLDLTLPRKRIAVLLPAHNESWGITATLNTLLPQLSDLDRLIVIADNCTDDTAAIALVQGAMVITRTDPDRRGKGYALDYGLKFLEADPPEIVVVVDADCIVQEGTIDKISRLADAVGKPVQSKYILQQPANPKPTDTISALAFMVKNLVRLQGLQRLNLPCLLSTGMAFPWSVISQISLASGNIVEDMQMTIDLVIAGYPTVFCSDAVVTGVLPQDQQAASGQRKRWEHGHLTTLLTQVPRLLKASMAQNRFDLLAMALDLCVPPLSLLVFLWMAAIVAGLLGASWGASWIPSIILAIEGILILIAIIGSWARFGRADIPLSILLAVPFYIIKKIPLYIGFVIKPETKWIRTNRDQVETSSLQD